MCGRYTTEMETDERQLFEILMRAEQNAQTLVSSCGKTVTVGREVFPSETAAVLAGTREGSIDAFAFRWGFDADIGGKRRLLINARAETAAEKAMFAPLLPAYRCVIPTAGFFEWAHNGDRVISSQKYRFNLPHTGILYLAGLYRPSPFLAGMHEFVVMTRAANDSMAPIHDRMPVVLREEHIDEYLHDTASAKKLLCETPPMLVKRLVS